MINNSINWISFSSGIHTINGEYIDRKTQWQHDVDICAYSTPTVFVYKKNIRVKCVMNWKSQQFIHSQCQLFFFFFIFLNRYTITTPYTQTSFVFLSASQDTLNLKPSAESLVKQQPGLEFWNEWEPGKYSHWCKDDQSHHVLVPTG